ncbi:BCCT family transporter [Domibacillus aminovorans]|uniref:Glycine/betaine ABC transporter permease n=1 Tax=Domibacillus aminovorans TaxID=29332 RepID=A0A177LC57_9BACI|nr:BCCT family transporter [Domibacillus aminovorans]OAH63173.1 glycine/betaine ABC transporter permease [Domibacillus aminovorans]
MKKLTPVFIISSVMTLIFIIWGALVPGNLSAVTSTIQTFLQGNFGWLYLTAATVFLVFLLYLAFSRYGQIRLGKDTDRPEFSTFTWLAMVFSAGMGIGLVFWGAAEPISHFHNPPFGKSESAESAALAMRYSFFHWGFHAWAIYAITGLAIAYFAFRKGASQVPSEILRPILGNKVEGGLGRAINIIFIMATVFAISGPLGMGATQISGGISYLTGIQNNFTTQVIVIGVVTVLFILSAQTGLERGIKYLSNTNVILAIFLMIFVFFAGPTTFIMNVFTSSFGDYIQNLPNMSLNQRPFEQSSWFQDWTVFYWAWWVAAAPFAGSFIARVSKGRTVREFVLGVLIVPTVFGILWFSIFGGTAISLEMFDHFGVKEIMDNQGVEVALFTILQGLPFGTVISFLGIILIGTFFITTADSGTFVLAMQSSNGNLNPSNSMKFTWGILQSLTAIVLLWSGGLGAIVSALIIIGFPLVIILLLTVFSLLKSFKNETDEKNLNEEKEKVS